MENLAEVTTTFADTGSWNVKGDRLRAVVSAKRFAPGPPGVFGLDEIDIVTTGHSRDGGKTASCTGFAKQSPGIRLEVTLIRTE